MAATIGRLITTGLDWTTTTDRPGTVSAEAQANTFDTFTTCFVKADGSGSVKVERNIDGKRVCVGMMEFGPEGTPSETTTILSGHGYITGRAVLAGEPLIEKLDHEPWMPIARHPRESGARPCPCGRMTSNDCAGECGEPDRLKLGKDATDDLMDGWPSYDALDQEVPRA